MNERKLWIKLRQAERKLAYATPERASKLTRKIVRLYRILKDPT